MKLKLRPTDKIKRRYILISGAKKEEIEKVILDYLGILGWAKATPAFLQSDKIGCIVLSIDRKEVDNVRASFELTQKDIKVLKISGTLKGLNK